VYTQLVSPTLPPGEAFNGMMFYTTIRDKFVYVRPQDQVIPLPPPVTKSKKKARASQDSDESTASEFGTERSVVEDDEILRIRGLFTSESSSTTAVDSIPETSLLVRAVGDIFGSDSSKSTKFDPDVAQTILFLFLVGAKVGTPRDRLILADSNMAAIGVKNQL
jgi:hypothetical protein